ncbi:TPA: hypothetical protein SIC62_000472 [Pasteurella multocida]|nr:hypothetical protein [Pasteurella multocida]HEA3244872.1 hypothetical protein [Pasteurella multocida]HED4430502.1 hypothetical protein [Pasteurella multocida]HEH9648559.1 hypothetical protein [Pasteurella multocida]HEH9711889.1 hypothetical protein [Pasteurella multocida]
MLIRNTLLLTISHMLSRGNLIFSSVIISSLMDKEQFSIYSYFILTTTTISIYSALGIGITTNKFFSSLKKELNLETPVMTLWIINISLAILGGVIFTLLSEQIIPKSINFNKNYFAIVILFLCLDIYTSNALIGLGEYIKLCITSLLFFCINIIMVVIAILNNNIDYAILGLISAVIVQLFFNTVFVLRYLSSIQLLEKVNIKIAHLKEILKTMGPMMFVSLFAASNTWIVSQYILVSNRESALEFNLFSIGLQWFSLALFLPSVFSRVLLNYFISHTYSNSLVIAKRNIALILSLFLLLTFVSYIASPIIQGIYSRYTIPAILIPLFLFIAGINSSTNILGNILISQNQEWVWLIFVTIGFLLLNILCSLIKEIDSMTGTVIMLINNILIFSLSLFYLFVYKKPHKEEIKI